MPDVRIDIPPIDDTKDASYIRLNGKKLDVDEQVKFNISLNKTSLVFFSYHMLKMV